MSINLLILIELRRCESQSSIRAIKVSIRPYQRGSANS